MLKSANTSLFKNNQTLKSQILNTLNLSQPSRGLKQYMSPAFYYCMPIPKCITGLIITSLH